MRDVLIGLLAIGAASAAGAAPPAKKAGPTAARPAPAKPASKPAAPAVYYDFKGAKLGMTIAEWKALPAPLADMSALSAVRSQDEEPERAWCSDERLSNGTEANGFYLSDTEKALGVVGCRYASQTGRSSYKSLMSAWVKVGEHITNDVSYKFMDGKLYEINITGSDNLLGDVVDGLTAKFGPPTKVDTDTTQNRAGATFPHSVRTWLNPVASIRVETPYTKINNLNVVYIANEALAKLSAKRDALHPAADKM